LDGRTSFANTRNADLFIAIHINASVNRGTQGTETYYWTAISQPLAQEIHKEFLQATGRPNRGVRTARFYVIRKTKMPSVLLECAFITNSTEEAKLMDPNWRENVARGITRGVLNYAAKYRGGVSG
jgi:N-acetylmuramoyl-L-alanine amidase